MHGSQHVGKKHDVGPGSAFYSLCDLGQVISPVKGSVSSSAIYHLYRAIVDIGKMVYGKCLLYTQYTTNFNKRSLLLLASFSLNVTRFCFWN